MLIKILAGVLLVLGVAFMFSLLLGALSVPIILGPESIFHPASGWVGLSGWFFDALAFIALVTLGGLLLNGGYWIHVYLEDRRGRAKAGAAEGEVGRRLDELEARTRDVLDVMIALSEKVDRWEREGAPSAQDRTPTS